MVQALTYSNIGELMRHLIGTILTALVVMTFVGCGPLPQPPFITQPSINQFSSVDGKWKVSHSGYVQIQQDKEGVVHIYGIAKSPNRSQVVLSGTATFKVHDVDVVYLQDGANAECYSCPEVRVEKGATANAYNCRKVLASDGAKVNAFGDTAVTRQAPVAPPATNK